MKDRRGRSGFQEVKNERPFGGCHYTFVPRRIHFRRTRCHVHKDRKPIKIAPIAYKNGASLQGDTCKCQLTRQQRHFIGSCN